MTCSSVRLRQSLFGRSTPTVIVAGTFIFLCLGIFIVISSHFPRAFDPNELVFPTHAIASGQVWTLEIANTEPLRTRGLGERDDLPAKTGMLFLFDQPYPYGFWMKGMRFPLDMVFLYRGRIVFIERGIQPDNPKIVTPPAPVDQVLELNAGEAKALSPGDRVWYWRPFSYISL